MNLERGRAAPTAAATEGAAAADPELVWLDRRRDLLSRSIAEMEQHQREPYLSQTLMPDIPGMLAWAREELARVDLCIAERGTCAPQRRLHGPHEGWQV